MGHTNPKHGESGTGMAFDRIMPVYTRDGPTAARERAGREASSVSADGNEMTFSDGSQTRFNGTAVRFIDPTGAEKAKLEYFPRKR